MSRSMTLVKPPTQAERIATLEKRADAYDKMVEQFAEIYDAWRSLKTINWFVVKLAAYIGGSLGAIAVVLTIVDKLTHLGR